MPVARALTINDRTRADETHVAFEDVDQLWQLVEAAKPQESPKGRNSGIARQLLPGRPLQAVIGVAREKVGERDAQFRVHRTKLEDPKLPASESDALLSEYDWAPIKCQDQEGHHDHKRAQEEKPDKTAGDVHASFESVAVRPVLHGLLTSRSAPLD